MARALPALLPLLCAVSAAHAEGTTYQVYFLGGQSNMEGLGSVSELPAGLAEPQLVPIFAGYPQGDGVPTNGLGTWAQLQPGFGAGYWSDGDRIQLADKFGPELSFGAALTDARPETPVAIIKYARGGSSLGAQESGWGTWDPDLEIDNQYDAALKTIRDAMNTLDIDGDGHADQLIPAGIVWMQGEADAVEEGLALEYEVNLKRTMDLLRAALRYDDLPVVIGKITDSGMDDDGKVMDYHEIVQEAQLSFTEKDACAAFVDEIDSYPHSDDKWHYEADGYVAMGRAFARAMIELEDSCGVAGAAD